MRITLSRQAAYELRDRLNDLLEVDELSPLEICKVIIRTPGENNSAPSDNAEIEMEFNELKIADGC